MQKFPFIVSSLRNQQGKKFAIIVDEAHAGQTGKTAAKMREALREGGVLTGGGDYDEGEGGVKYTEEDAINDAVENLINERRPLENASYFAFTATPKAKTLEIFGKRRGQMIDGKTPYCPHHVYWMKQAIEERFILDVLASYTPVSTALNIIKTVDADPRFDAKRAQKKLRRYVERHLDVVEKKAEVMVDHFYGCKIDKNIDCNARAMVVCGSIDNVLDYYVAINKLLEERGVKDKAWAAFSGEHEKDGKKFTETGLNGFSENQTAEKFRESETARFLICAEKFQVGYDEPLLQVMYVDKPLSGIMAVQTLSRINRIHPLKGGCFVLDFAKSQEAIIEAFQDYYQTTILADKADPNKLHDLKNGLDGAGVYSGEDVKGIVCQFLKNASRDELEEPLNACRDRYMAMDDVGKQIKFKGDAKTFYRFYEFIGTVLSYNMPEWEELSIFLNLLIPKLPSPDDEDLSRGILDRVDLESYRARKQAEWRIEMEDENAEIDHAEEKKSGNTEPEMEPLTRILKRFHQRFNKENLNMRERDEIWEWLNNTIVPKVKSNEAYQNSLQNTPNEARGECDEALTDIRTELNVEDGEMPLDLNDPDIWEDVKDFVFESTKAG